MPRYRIQGICAGSELTSFSQQVDARGTGQAQRSLRKVSSVRLGRTAGPTLSTDNKDAVRNEKDSSVRERRGNDVERIVGSVGEGGSGKDAKYARKESSTGAEGND